MTTTVKDIAAVSLDPTAPANINDPGTPGSIQRLCYLVPRARALSEWREVRHLTGELLERVTQSCSTDTELSLLLNAVAAMAEEIVRGRNGANALLEQMAKLVGEG